MAAKLLIYTQLSENRTPLFLIFNHPSPAHITATLSAHPFTSQPQTPAPASTHTSNMPNAHPPFNTHFQYLQIQPPNPLIYTPFSLLPATFQLSPRYPQPSGSFFSPLIAPESVRTYTPSSHAPFYTSARHIIPCRTSRRSSSLSNLATNS